MLRACREGHNVGYRSDSIATSRDMGPPKPPGIGSKFTPGELCFAAKEARGLEHYFWTKQNLTNFFAPFFKEIPSFFCGVTPFKTLAAPQPLNIGFPLGNGGVLRSEKGEGFRKEGDSREGEKRRKRGRAKSAQKLTELSGIARCGVSFGGPIFR